LEIVEGQRCSKSNDYDDKRKILNTVAGPEISKRGRGTPEGGVPPKIAKLAGIWDLKS
jgi:hypothetical protein